MEMHTCTCKDGWSISQYISKYMSELNHQICLLKLKIGKQLKFKKNY